MADTPIPVPVTPTIPVPPPTESSFLPGTPTAPEAGKDGTTENALYNDFFQENSNGEIRLGGKKERSTLEIVVSILQYITICIVIVWILFGAHIYMRSSQSVSFLETYPFLCPYLHYDIDAPAENKWCKSIGIIKQEYTEKQAILEENIVSKLTEYIPIKVSSNILDASPEKRFIIDTYDNKPNVKDVLEAFGQVKSSSQSASNSIECTGLTVTNGNSLSTQCTIYGGGIGDTDTNGELGSARIQALRFIENLGNTSKSSLILENQPTSLGIEKLSSNESIATGFSTRTTIPVQVRYVPLVQKI